MKKILLLVSGFLIICMAGTAMATLDINGASIGIYEDTFNHTSVVVYDLLPGNYTLTLKPQVSNIYAYIDANSGSLIDVGGESDLASLNSPKLVTFRVQANQPQYGTLYIKGTGSGYVTATLTDLDRSTSTSEIIQADSIYTNPIPEFPTVALPIAALIGLVFIFGRKKEEK